VPLRDTATSRTDLVMAAASARNAQAIVVGCGARCAVVEVGGEDGLEGVVLFGDPVKRRDVVDADSLV